MTELRSLQQFLNLYRPNIIINFAAQGEGAASWQQSGLFFDTNCSALVRMVEWLQDKQWLERFVHISTSELYGSVRTPATEDAPFRASSPYSASKAGFDLYLQAMIDRRCFPANILRPCNAYCAGQGLHRIIPRAVYMGLHGRKIDLHGGGLAEKSYIHARDLARAIEMVCMGAPIGAVYNVGADLPISIRDVVRLVADYLSVKFDDLVDLAPERLGQDGCYWLDSSRIREAVGWQPTIGWDTGLAEMVDWVRNNLAELKTAPLNYRLRA